MKCVKWKIIENLMMWLSSLGSLDLIDCHPWCGEIAANILTIKLFTKISDALFKLLPLLNLRHPMCNVFYHSDLIESTGDSQQSIATTTTNV